MDTHKGTIIEVDDEALGLLVPGDEELVFHAVHPAVRRLHGKRYVDGVVARREALKAFRTAA